jgi:hypothetical protein
MNLGVLDAMSDPVIQGCCGGCGSPRREPVWFGRINSPGQPLSKKIAPLSL